MAASSVQPDHHRGGAAGHPRSVKSRRPLLGHLNVQVPAVGNASSFFHPSPKSAPSAATAHADRPASPSLLRSPSAWIRAKGHGFASGKHTPRPSKNFCYDARSYAQNFDDGGCEEEAFRYRRCFSPRLPTSPQPGSPSGPAGTYHSGGNGKQPAGSETGLDS